MTFRSRPKAPDAAMVVAGYQGLDKSIQAYYILMAACGINSSNFFRVFRVPPEERKVQRIRKSAIPGMKSDVIVIETPELARGIRRIECVCFPPELEEAVRNFTVIWTADHYKRQVRLDGAVIPISAVREWNYALILDACWKEQMIPSSPVEVNRLVYDCYRRVNILHGNVSASDAKRELDHRKRMEEAIVTYSYAAKEIASALCLPEYMLKGETRFVSEHLSAEERAKRDEKVVSMLRAKTPAGEYVYTHAVIRKETGITSRSLNRLIAEHHLERGQAGGRAKGLPKPRKNTGV